MRLTNTTLLALGLVAAMGHAQTLTSTAAANQAPIRSDTPTIHVYSRETLIDVTVTDAKDQPVHGLKQSDFTVEEDGTPQPIRSFREFSKDPLAATPLPSKLAPNIYTNLQPTTGPLNVLLLDYINGTSVTVARAVRFVNSLPPGTQGAVLGLGMRLTVLQGPTADPSLLLKAVTRYVEPFAAEGSTCTLQTLANWATLDQLNEVATYVSGIAGRKNLIWIGVGTPSIIFPPRVIEGCDVPDVGPALRKTYDLLADAEVTVYPVDPSGVGKLTPSQLAMEAVAEATGGIAYYETNDVGNAILKAVEAGTNYYAISYVPPSLAYDGRYHAISIKVDRPDVHLTYRKGYSAEDPIRLAHTTASGHPESTTETHPDVLAAAMAPLAPPATKLLFNVRVGPTSEPPMPSDPPVIGALNPKLKNTPLTRYDFLYMLPQSQIAFAAAGDGTYSGSLEFEVAAFDLDGRLVTIRSQTLKLPLTNDEYKDFIATPFQFFLQLDLPPGQMTLRVGILDGVSNKIGTLEIPLTVGKGSIAATK